MCTEFTLEDLRYGEDHKESRRELRLINEELGQYSQSTIAEFEKKFPCKKRVTYIEVHHKDYVEEQLFIAFNKHKAELGGLRPECVEERYVVYYLEFNNVKDFWERWDRFKNLRAFL